MGTGAIREIACPGKVAADPAPPEDDGDEQGPPESEQTL